MIMVVALVVAVLLSFAAFNGAGSGTAVAGALHELHTRHQRRQQQQSSVM